MLCFMQKKFCEDLRKMCDRKSYRHCADMTFGVISYPTLWRIANIEDTKVKLDDIINICNFLGMNFFDYIWEVS